MLGLILVSLLSVGALTTFIVDEIDDDDSPSSPQTPGGGGGDGPTTPGPSDDLIGGEEADLILGTSGDDLISGNGGDDDLSGGNGNDQINGGAGDDSLSGDFGQDLLFGGEGDDSIYASDGSDIASGGDGDDEIWGGSDNDFLIGGDGSDTLIGSTGDDVLIGTQSDVGDGTVAEFLTEIEGAGTDQEALLTAINVPEAGSDTDAGDDLRGGFGDDAILIGSDDTATGGAGNDIFNLGDWIAADSEATITDYDPNRDTIAFSYSSTEAEPEISIADDDDGNAVISANGAVVATVTGAAGSLSVEDITLIGDAPQDPEDGISLAGSDDDDTLTGTDNDDLISANLGDDVVLGLGGADIMRGNEGNDLVDAGDGDDRAFGGEDTDTLLGGAGNDFLRGGSEADVIIDTEGQDTLRGDTGEDTIISGNFVDESILSAALQDGQSFTTDSLDLSQDNADEGDVVHGGDGDDTMYFGSDDTVTGGRGADTFVTTDAALGNGASEITDFDLDQDVMIVSVADEGAAPLEISYTAGADAESGDAIVRMGDTVLMVVQGVGTGFTAANITLEARASA